jgi:hypothetical protein
MTPPNGYKAIAAFYEWDPAYLTVTGTVSPSWEADNMARIALPAPLKLSWDLKVAVKRMTVHKKLAPVYLTAFEEVFNADLWRFLGPFGGAYNFRIKRTNGQLSMHAFGAATDHDPKRNPMGFPATECRMGSPACGELVEIMKNHGFTWGGLFGNPDAMHFQYGSGY